MCFVCVLDISCQEEHTSTLQKTHSDYEDSCKSSLLDLLEGKSTVNLGLYRIPVDTHRDRQTTSHDDVDAQQDRHLLIADDLNVPNHPPSHVDIVSYLPVELLLFVTVYGVIHIVTHMFSTSESANMENTLSFGLCYGLIQLVACMLWGLMATHCYMALWSEYNHSDINPAAMGSNYPYDQSQAFLCYIDTTPLKCSFKPSQATNQNIHPEQSILTLIYKYPAMAGNIMLCLTMCACNIFLLVLAVHVIVVEYMFWFLFVWIPMLVGIRKTAPR